MERWKAGKESRMKEGEGNRRKNERNFVFPTDNPTVK